MQALSRSSPKGQSLNHICTTHADELGISERTLYNYIDKNVFKVRNIDFPKKVVYRARRPKRVLTKLEYQYRQGRTIEDFNSFVEANPDVSIVEMDTVKGSREKGKVFLTMIFRKKTLSLTSASVTFISHTSNFISDTGLTINGARIPYFSILSFNKCISLSISYQLTIILLC